MFSTARSYSVTRSAPGKISFGFALHENANVLFFFDPVPPVPGRAFVMISPAWKANDTRKSWIFSRLGAAMAVSERGLDVRSKELWESRVPQTTLEMRGTAGDPPTSAARSATQQCVKREGHILRFEIATLHYTGV